MTGIEVIPTEASQNETLVVDFKIDNQVFDFIYYSFFRVTYPPGLNVINANQTGDWIGNIVGLASSIEWSGSILNPGEILDLTADIQMPAAPTTLDFIISGSVNADGSDAVELGIVQIQVTGSTPPDPEPAEAENVEQIVVSWLNTLDLGCEAHGNKPKPKPDKYILVDRTGGPREAMVLDKAEILIEVYNKDSRIDASNLANVIGDRIIELEAYNDNITRAKVTSIVSLEDLIAQYERYQIYCDVFHRR